MATTFRLESKLFGKKAEMLKKKGGIKGVGGEVEGEILEEIKEKGGELMKKKNFKLGKKGKIALGTAAALGVAGGIAAATKKGKKESK